MRIILHKRSGGLYICPNSFPMRLAAIRAKTSVSAPPATATKEEYGDSEVTFTISSELAAGGIKKS